MLKTARAASPFSDINHESSRKAFETAARPLRPHADRRHINHESSRKAFETRAVDASTSTTSSNINHESSRKAFETPSDLPNLATETWSDINHESSRKAFETDGKTITTREHVFTGISITNLAERHLRPRLELGLSVGVCGISITNLAERHLRLELGLGVCGRRFGYQSRI